MPVRQVLTALLALLLTALGGPALARPGGRLVEVERIAVPGLPDQRLTIWLPPGYDTVRRRYPVVYMHDGHNLFELKNSNFNKIWAADQAMLAAMATGQVEPHIIVGIWAPGNDRYRQYLPRTAWLAASPQLHGRMDALAGGPVMQISLAEKALSRAGAGRSSLSSSPSRSWN